MFKKKTEKDVEREKHMETVDDKQWNNSAAYCWYHSDICRPHLMSKTHDMTDRHEVNKLTQAVGEAK